MKKNNPDKRFPGFPRRPAKNYWQYPRIMDSWWTILNGSEQKALDYILRHTWGYKKIADFISYDQFTKGIKNKTTGNWVDKGCGIKSRKTLSSAIKGLVIKGFIKRYVFNGRVTSYRLCLNNAEENKFLVQKMNYASLRSKLVGSSKSKHTIKDITIKERQYGSSRKLKPYFWDQEMRRYDEKWWCIPREGGKWLEFAGKESEIEWK